MQLDVELLTLQRSPVTWLIRGKPEIPVMQGEYKIDWTFWISGSQQGIWIEGKI